MKKVLLFFSFILCITLNAQTFVSTEPSKKNALLEEFTGVTCQYCPDGHRIANQLIANNPGLFFAINIHQGIYAQTNPDFRTEFGDAIANQTGLTGYPMGTISRHVFSGSNTAMDRGQWSNRATQIMAQDSYVNIAAVSSIDALSRELTVTVELYYTADADVDTNFLNVALLQNNILGPQTGMNYNPTQVINGRYNHQHMLRHLLTGQWGEEITEVSQGSFITKTYTYTIPEHLRNVKYEISDLDIIVFIAEGHQEIITAAKSEMSFTNNYPEIRALREIETYSCAPEVLLSATVFNFSEEVMNKINFTYKFDGELENTFIWNNRSIAPMTTDTLNFCYLPIISGEEHKILITLTSFNDNDEITGAIPYEITVKKTIKEAIGEEFAFILATDRFASQTSYKFFDSNGNVIMSAGPWTNLTYNGITVRQYLFEPPKPGSYKLEVYDTAGNGINSGNGEGYIQLSDINDNLIFYDDGKFGYQANYYINVSQNLSIGNYKVENELILFPNPVRDILSVESDLYIISVEITNLQGQKIIFTDKKEIDVSQLSSGVYLVYVNTNEGIVVNKVIKK